MSNAIENLNFAEISIQGGVSASTSLIDMLMAPDIAPGSDPSYQLCKTIYLYHPLGAKMAEGPIKIAQSQEREITIQDAPDEVKRAFITKWEELEADANILNLHAQSRVYGIASLVLGIEDYPTDKPAQMEKLYKQSIFFNVYDPLNTAGSLVLSQQTNSASFQKPRYVSTGSAIFHLSRAQIVMNEQPIFIAYTSSAFGFVGRSVYQRALFPLKSFIKTMVADDMIATKLGVLIAKMKAPGSIINQAMQKIAGWKRWLLKLATTGQVMTIDPEEEITTLNMQNVDGAGKYSRDNIVRNIETAADMPAKMLDQETMASGLSDGTEDAKRNAQYIERIRIKMRPAYKWMDNIAQYLAWNPEWYKTVIQAKYEEYQDIDWATAFMQWRRDFHAEWPSLLLEPESEAIKREAVILEAIIAALNTLLPVLDPLNKTILIQWAADLFAENKRLFPRALEFDWEELEQYQMDQQKREEETHDASLEPAEGGKKFPKFGDAAAVRTELSKLMDAVARLTKPKVVA